jgi:hypothetical protein
MVDPFQPETFTYFKKHMHSYLKVQSKEEGPKHLLPLLPTTKLTLEPNLKGPSIEWHMKFLS